MAKKAKKTATAEPEHDRIVLLNTMLSFSTGRAGSHEPPTLGALESLKMLDARRKKGSAVEFIGLDEKPLGKFKDSEQSEQEWEAARLKFGAGHDFVRLSAMRFHESEEDDGYVYATLLVETADAKSRTFAVVNVDSFEGREITADAKERGSASAHIVVRIPKDGISDTGKYRCAIETVHPITRSEIEALLCRQLRRAADTGNLTFPVKAEKKEGGFETKNYRFNPRLELVADVGRRLSAGAAGGILSHIVVTKRSEKLTVGKGTVTDHEEVEADIHFTISGSQGPDDPGQRRTWATGVADWLRGQGHEVKFYFRHANGRIEGGALHKAIAGATDLLMCPRTQITLKKAPKTWVSSINSEVETALRELVDRDELWERSK